MTLKSDDFMRLFTIKQQDLAFSRFARNPVRVRRLISGAIDFAIVWKLLCDFPLRFLAVSVSIEARDLDLKDLDVVRFFVVGVRANQQFTRNKLVSSVLSLGQPQFVLVFTGAFLIFTLLSLGAIDTSVSARRPCVRAAIRIDRARTASIPCTLD